MFARLNGTAEDRWEKVGYEFNTSKMIGNGAFGNVFEGRSQWDPHQKVAVKVVQIVRNSNLRREIDMLKEISRVNHQNFVQLLYCEEQLSRIILVMELCNEDMANYLEKHGKIPEAVVAIFLRQIVNGLEVLDSHNIIHRDLKPQNLLLSYSVENPKPEEIIVKIADFGLARILPDDYFQQMTQCGTIAYMAPEILQSQSYNSKVDIWSVGVISHMMVFGKLPFEKFGQAFKKYECPISASPRLRNLLCRILRHNPAKRIDLQSLASHCFLIQPPDTWNSKTIDSAVVKLVSSSEEFKMVEVNFMKTMNKSKPQPKILEVMRVENPALYSQYWKRRQLVSRRLKMSEQDVEKVPLWHGSTEQNVFKIARSYFDKDKAGVNFDESTYDYTIIGCYFAERSQYAAQKWLAKPNAAGEQFVIQARVILGKSYQAYRIHHDIPADADSAYGHMVQSAHFNFGDAHVVFDKASAYPEYIIKFKY